MVCFPLPALREQQQHAAETPPCSCCAGWDLNEVYVHLHLLCCRFSGKLRGPYGPKYRHICMGWGGWVCNSGAQNGCPTHWGPTPPKQQAFTRVPKGPRQVTPKLSRSPYRHSSSCPWGTHSQGDSPAAITHCPHSYPALQTARDKFNILTTKHQPQAVYFSLPLKELTNQENFLSFLAVGFFSLFCSKCNRRQHSSLAYCNSPIFEVLQQVI